jgi:hypothetical protein
LTWGSVGEPAILGNCSAWESTGSQDPASITWRHQVPGPWIEAGIGTATDAAACDDVIDELPRREPLFGCDLEEDFERTLKGMATVLGLPVNNALLKPPGSVRQRCSQRRAIASTAGAITMVLMCVKPRAEPRRRPGPLRRCYMKDAEVLLVVHRQHLGMFAQARTTLGARSRPGVGEGDSQGAKSPHRGFWQQPAGRPQAATRPRRLRIGTSFSV